MEVPCEDGKGGNEALGRENDMHGGAFDRGWKPFGEFRLRIDLAPSMSSHDLCGTAMHNQGCWEHGEGSGTKQWI